MPVIVVGLREEQLAMKYPRSDVLLTGQDSFLLPGTPAHDDETGGEELFLTGREPQEGEAEI